MSKLIYLMPVWMGCDDYLVKALQVCQNKVARLVKKLDRYTLIKVLIQQCGWTPDRQLMTYHSLLLLHKSSRSLHLIFIKFSSRRWGSSLPGLRT